MRTRVLVVGGDKKVIPLLEILSDVSGVEIVGLCDTRRDSEGMKAALNMGLKTSTDISEFVERRNIDIIIETSGSNEFQKVLQQIVPKDVRVVDAKAATLIMTIAEKKEKLKRYDQLSVVDKLSDILASGYDMYNVAKPIFDLLKDDFNTDMVAILVLIDERYELIVASSYLIDSASKELIINQLERTLSIGDLKSMNIDGLNVISKVTTKGSPPLPPMESILSIPLITRAENEGAILLGSSKRDAFTSDDRVVLNIFAHEFALFVENEKIKRGLADSKMRLESMLKSMSEGVIALGVNQEVILINPAGRDLLELSDVKYGRALWESISNQMIMELHADMKRGEGIISREIDIGNLEDEHKYIRFHIAPARDSLGAHSGWIMILTDISKEKEVDRMKSEFISTTSHELRTPLAAIKESVMLILDETAGEVSKEQDRFLTIAKRNIDRLSQLINDLLDISKIETGKVALKLIEHSIEDLLNGVIDSMELLARDNNLKLKCDVSKKLPLVKCDGDRVIQIFINLISNAIKFTPEGGEITIHAHKHTDAIVKKIIKEDPSSYIEGDSIIIAVSDTGMGIEKKNMERLFTRFSQLDGSLTRRPGGTGLGLAICKELVGMHGGKIWVESEYGSGSTFIFTLPL
jgi:signal transduction histidine kinase